MITEPTVLPLLCGAVHTAVIERYSDVEIAANVGLPSAAGSPQSSAAAGFVPRLGSFEVVAVLPSGRTCLLWSKLATTAWPSVGDVVARLDEVKAWVTSDSGRPMPDFYAPRLPSTSPSHRAAKLAVSIKSSSRGHAGGNSPGVRPRSGAARVASRCRLTG